MLHQSRKDFRFYVNMYGVVEGRLAFGYSRRPCFADKIIYKMKDDSDGPRQYPQLLYGVRCFQVNSRGWAHLHTVQSEICVPRSIHPFHGTEEKSGAVSVAMRIKSGVGMGILLNRVHLVITLTVEQIW